MLRRPGILLAAALTALAAAPPAEAGLRLTRGAVRVEAAQLRGTLVVRNTGPRAGAGTARLTVVLGGHPQVVARVRTGAVRPHRTKRVTVRAPVPTWPLFAPRLLRACLPALSCRVVGRAAAFGPSSKGVPIDGDPPGPAAAPGGPPLPQGTTVPPDPLAFTADTPFQLAGAWLQVPSGYDATHRTPSPLFVWLHGCGGESRWDILDVAPATSSRRLVLAPGGREGGCWQMGADDVAVLGAVDEVRRHFNVDPAHVVLGGYSSGGDLAYRLAFLHPDRVAGVLAENTSPFRDTGLTSGQALAAVGAARFPVVHLAHTGDTTYPLAGVRAEVGALRGAGFDVTLLERGGQHWDGATVSDLQTLLLPRLAEPWAG